jgi:cobalamin biosynthetic protein CobC
MLEHGGNLAAASQQYGIALQDWLDLSTGINPHGYPITGMPPEAWQRLPLENDGLIEAACAYYGCRFALPTAGSQAALQVLPQLRAGTRFNKPAKVAMPQLMYQEHAKAWQRHGHEVIRFDTSPDQTILQQADVLLLCNPNNPTGTRFSAEQLLHWHAELAQRGGWLIVDEAFMDATPEDSTARHADQEGLFVLRSLGKFFGLAGARVGFLLTTEQMLLEAQEIIGPWSVTGPSRHAARTALEDQVWQQDTRHQLLTNSQRLADLLAQHGLQPAGGTALFQFVLTPDAATWHQHLARQGIWVRLFPEVPALRFGLPPENAWNRLRDALQT